MIRLPNNTLAKTPLKYLNEETKDLEVKKRPPEQKWWKNLNNCTLVSKLATELDKDKENLKKNWSKMSFLSKTCLTQSKSKTYSVMVIEHPSIILTFNNLNF